MRGLVLLGVVLAIVLVVFAVQNNVPVTITMFLWHLESTLALVLLLSFAGGAVMAVLLTLPAAWRRGRNFSRQRREVEELRTHLAENARQLAQLRAASDSAGQEVGRRRTVTSGTDLLGLPPLV